MDTEYLLPKHHEESSKERTDERKSIFATPGHTSYNGGLSKDFSPHVTDEVFNGASHLVGAMISLVASVWMIARSCGLGNPWGIVSFSLYGFCSVGLFTASFLHHGVHVASMDKYFRTVDYMFIYFMIAGTYTPLCLVYMHHCWRGWAYFGVVWTLAILGGIFSGLFGSNFPKWLQVTWFGSMGGLGAILCFTIFNLLGKGGLISLLIGGAFYISGTTLMVFEVPNPFPGKFGFHEIFHFFVLMGAISHQIMLYFFVLPYDGDGTCAV